MGSQTDQPGIVAQEPTTVVQVMRTWEITGAPDWTPKFKSRAIVPTTVTAVWVDGQINRVSVTGPYRMKSGGTAQPKGQHDTSHIGGTGDPNYRADYDRMRYVRCRADGTWDDCTSNQFPGWVERFVTDRAPGVVEVR